MSAPLLVTANSPGEISGWLRPIARQWYAQAPERPIVVVLLPCNFATGEELRVAQSLPGVERVFPVKSLFRFFWKEGEAYRGATHFHLGGDLMYAAALSWRFSLQSYSYLWARRWWDFRFRGYFTKNTAGLNWLKKRGISPQKVQLVGDLTVDSVLQKVTPGRGEPFQISLMPGSRPIELIGLVPFYLEMAEKIQAHFPEATFKLHLSPYLPTDSRDRLLSGPPMAKVGGLQGRLDGEHLISPGGTVLHVVTEDSLETLSRSSLAISIPGTKTGEAGCLGVPCLTLIPMNRLELLPALGPLALLDWLPGGEHLKARILRGKKGNLGFVSQPNILANEELMPEMVDILTPGEVASRAIELLEDRPRLDRVRMHLIDIFGQLAGASTKIVDHLLGGPQF